MIRHLISAVLLLAGYHAINTSGPVYVTESGHVTFTSSVPLHSFSGESDHLTGMIDPDSNLVDFYLDLKTLKTGIRKRDSDMYKTLNVETHPFAEFTGTLDNPLDLSSGEHQSVEVTGTFTINGIQREKSVEGTISKQVDSIYLKASFTINLDDYEIEPPGILFYRVDETQEIDINTELTPRARDSVYN
ncbi:YceI family protein [Rhodohalobacter mucosus]|uniref:YceI family protein n=1 Tax=Rhodohalobacter mucosus TaxID=2079485 RepID=A0A316TRV2_9BACT|nr:YceI family protein [Rhodohalobacter mucosus]PWN07353.1 YceI family protein [Rhodohalobacter mucosus]